MKYFKYIATGVIASMTFVSCSNFLDEVPDQRTKIDTVDKAKDLLVNAYPLANIYYALDAMSDNFGDSRRVQNTKVDNVRYYRWETEMQEQWDSPAEFWESSYLAIAHANQALFSVEEVSGSLKEKNSIKGEALLARAYNHLMLANVFCEAYDPSTADSKLGIPYNTAPERVLIKDYKRGTLAEVYANLEKDIEEGLKLVQDDYKQPGYHFTRAAGKALAARFYAHKGDWEKVYDLTNDLGDFPVNKLRNYNADLAQLPLNEQGQMFGSAKMATNLLVSGSRSQIGRFIAKNRFGTTRPIFNALAGPQYNPFSLPYIHPSYWAGQDIYFYPRFYEYFVYSNQSSGSGQPYVNIALLTNDELYLYRIEALIMKKDFDKAAKMMGYFAKFRTASAPSENTVTVQRLLAKVNKADEYQPFYDLDPTQRKLVKFVAEMRRTEFLHMGLRWFDIKRFNLPVEHKLDVEGEVLKLSERDVRKAVQLPLPALSAGLTPNPRD